MEYEFVLECGADLPGKTIPFTRKHFLDLKDLNQFRDRFSNRGIYHTQMIYVNPIWIKNSKEQLIVDAAKSLKISAFYLDFDGSNDPHYSFYQVKEDVLLAIRYLHKIYEVPLSCIKIYFSGSKGVHVIIPYECLQFKPNQHIHHAFKQMAQRIENHLKHSTLDVKIYDDKRLFRYANSIHLKTGLFKIPLQLSELIQLNYEQICLLAKQKREENKATVVTCLRLVRQFEHDLMELGKEKEKKASIFIADDHELPACIQVMHQKLFYETIDQRNNSCAALASYYYQKDKSKEQVLEMMLEWNETQCVPALPKREIERTVFSVFDHGYTYGCESFETHSGVCAGKKCPYYHL